MDKTEETITIQLGETRPVSKGQEFTPFDAQTAEKTLDHKPYALKEDNKTVGMLEITADQEKAKSVTGHPSNAWAITAEASIDTEGFVPEHSLRTPGESFKALLAKTPNGRYFVCFAANMPAGDDEIRNFIYDEWFEKTEDEINNLKIKSKPGHQWERSGNPLTLTGDQLSKTTFKFI